MATCTEANCSTETDLRCDGPTGAGCGEPFCGEHLLVTTRDGDLCAIDYDNVEGHAPEVEDEDR